jgi:hypothetical protein
MYFSFLYIAYLIIAKGHCTTLFFTVRGYSQNLMLWVKSCIYVDGIAWEQVHFVVEIKRHCKSENIYDFRLCMAQVHIVLFGYHISFFPANELNQKYKIIYADQKKYSYICSACI